MRRESNSSFNCVFTLWAILATVLHFLCSIYLQIVCLWQYVCVYDVYTAGTTSTEMAVTDCDVGPPSSRVNCGYIHMPSHHCPSRGCCWDSSVWGVPWCFYGKDIFTAQCNIYINLILEVQPWCAVSIAAREKRESLHIPMAFARELSPQRSDPARARAKPNQDQHAISRRPDGRLTR